MKVLVTGANGKTGRLVVRQLIDSGHDVSGLIRKQKQEDQLLSIGATPLVKDVNDENLAEELTGIDAVIFAAAGSSGHHQEVDHYGVKNLIEACQAKKIDRFVLISALGAHDPGSWVFAYKGYLLTRGICRPKQMVNQH